MIVGKIEDCQRYAKLHALFPELFEFVLNNDLSKFAPGRIVLRRDNLFINIVETTLKPADEQKMEAHRQYIDVHIPLNGPETCGVTDIRDLTVESDEPFNEADDYALYSERARNYFTVHPGEFYIVFPEDAHAPAIGEGTIKKVIAKVEASEASDSWIPY